jgi:hypothetical protein
MSTLRILLLSMLTLGLAAALFFGIRFIGHKAVGPRPDLTFASFAAPAAGAANPGEPSEIEILLKNVGLGALEDAVEIVAFAGDPRGGETPQRVAVGRVAPPIGPGESRRATLSFSTPDEPGAFDYYFAIDPDEEIAEISRENNVLLSRIHVSLPAQPIPDLVVSDIRFDPPAPRSNQDILVVAAVRNEGDASTAAASLVDLYINDPLGPMGGLPGSRRLTLPPLAAGESTEVSARVRFDEAQLVGVYARVDTEEQIDERSDANNLFGPAIVAVGTAEQRGDPDLLVESIEFVDGKQHRLGDKALMRVRVANRGKADTTSSFTVNVSYRPSDGWGPSYPREYDEEPMWSRDLRFLAVDQSYVLPLIEVPFVRSGEWTAVAVVDPYDEVSEGVQEKNNLKEIRWTVSSEN